MTISVATCVLLAIWPLLNFLSYNRYERLELQPVLIAGLLSVLSAVLLAFVVHLMHFRRTSLHVTLPASGLLVAAFWSYDLVEEAYLRLALPRGTGLLAWLLLSVLVGAVALRAFRREAVLRATALSACVMVAIPAVGITSHGIKNFEPRSDSSRDPVTPIRDPDASVGHLPNIYFFILDMYSRGDNLREYYGYDNSQFLEFLERSGFYIARRSYSNYGSTEASVTATLFMDYFQAVVINDVPTFREPSSAVPLIGERADVFDSDTGTFETGTYAWRALGNNVVENDAQTLKVTRAGGSDSDNGAYNYLAGSQDLISDLVVGDFYRLKLDAKMNAGASVRIAIGGEGVNLDVAIKGSSFETHTIDFSPTSATRHFVFFSSMEIGDTIWIDNIELHRLGSSMSKVLTDIEFDFRPDSSIFNAYLGSYQHLSPVLSTMRALNYRVLFANQAGTQTDACAPYCIEGQQHPEFQEIQMLKMTPIFDYVETFHPDIWKNLTQSYQKSPLDVVQKIPKDVPKPFFLFAHILSPHPPYIYHSDCSIRDEFRFELDPSVSVFRDREEMYALYREQLTCVTELMRQTVVTILEEDPEALIVIQGDHGLGKLEDNRYAPFEHGKARYGILNALRVPQPCSEFLYESISPVNTFRLVFACLNGTRPNFVPDRMFGNSSQHLNTTDVTEEILPPEQGSRTTVPE